MSTTVERSDVFEVIKESVKVDEKGRVLIGRERSSKDYRVAVSNSGEILLTPMGRIPEREMWLYQNPQALAQLEQGVAEAAAGHLIGGYDFSTFLEDTLEDENEE